MSKEKQYKTKKKGGARTSHKVDRILRQEEEMDFATEESFNQLRTNITLSFTENTQTRVIGVTSSMKGEGKSFVSCCLANSLTKMGKNVLLIDSDMRLPTIAKKLGLQNSPGLSNLLTGSENDIARVIHWEGFGDVNVITAGDIPPNPSELLSSERTKQLIQLLSERYDYIIVDLPPVTVVTDALVVSKYIDGLILVVRHEHADKGALGDSLRQIKMVNAKLLGFVYNGKFAHSGKYYKYGDKYGYDKYGYGYAKNRKKNGNGK